jgi:hypothetical protein
MTVAGISTILLLGMLNMALVLFQIGTGLRWIRVPFKLHRWGAYLLCLSGAVHGTLAFLVS